LATRSPQRRQRTPISQEALAGVGDLSPASSTPPSRQSGDSARGDFLICAAGVVLHRVRSGLCWNGIHAPRPGVPPAQSSRPEAEPLAASSASSCVTAIWTSLLPMDLGLAQPLGAAAGAACCWPRITSRGLEMEREDPDRRTDDFLRTLGLLPRESSRLLTSTESLQLQSRAFLSAVQHTAGIFAKLWWMNRFDNTLVDEQIAVQLMGIRI
jgi:hypothetical protein